MYSPSRCLAVFPTIQHYVGILTRGSTQLYALAIGTGLHAVLIFNRLVYGTLGASIAAPDKFLKVN